MPDLVRVRAAPREAVVAAATPADPQAAVGVVSLVRPAPARRPASRWPVAAALASILVALLAYAVYQVAVASDTYVVQFRFAVRQADQPRMVSGLGVGIGTPMIASLTESHAVVQHLRSQDAVASLLGALDLQAMFGRADIDPIARLAPGATQEDLVRYLGTHLRPHYDHTSGIISVEVSAFSAADALALAQQVERMSEELVNALSLSARRGLLASAEADMARGEERLSRARDALRDFRQQNELLDPRQSAEATGELIARLEGEIAQLDAQAWAMRRFTADTAPAVLSLRDRIDSLRQQVQSLRQRATADNRQALSTALRGYEALDTEAMMALKSYEGLLATLERTRSDANRQMVYLAHVVRPILPTAPLRPRRIQNILTAAAIAALGALLTLIVARAVREHLG